jgi:hypothetical protein
MAERSSKPHAVLRDNGFLELFSRFGFAVLGSWAALPGLSAPVLAALPLMTNRLPSRRRRGVASTRRSRTLRSIEPCAESVTVLASPGFASGETAMQPNGTLAPRAGEVGMGCVRARAAQGILRALGTADDARRCSTLRGRSRST